MFVLLFIDCVDVLHCRVSCTVVSGINAGLGALQNTEYVRLSARLGGLENSADNRTRR